MLREIRAVCRAFPKTVCVCSSGQERVRLQSLDTSVYLTQQLDVTGVALKAMSLPYDKIGVSRYRVKILS